VVPSRYRDATQSANPKGCLLRIVTVQLLTPPYAVFFSTKHKATQGMKGKMKDRLSYCCHQTGSTTAPAAISRRQEWKGYKELKVGR